MTLLMILNLNLVSWLQILVVSVITKMKYVSGITGGTWKCTAKCKALTQFEVDTVLEFKSHFKKPLRDVMSWLSMCDDDCPFTHHSKICDVNESDVQRKATVLCYEVMNARTG